MAIRLQDKQNTDAPSGAYPYGKIRNNTGGNNGTPVNEQVYGDFHQFFAKMLADSGITPNGLPDNATNGFQYYLAMRAVIQQFVDALVAAAPGSLDTLNELAQALGDDPNFATTVLNNIAAEATARQNAINALKNVSWTVINSVSAPLDWSDVANSRPRYYQDGLGLVHISGCLQILWSSYSSGTALPIFTLPAGMRPIADLLLPGTFILNEQDLANPIIEIRVTGEVMVIFPEIFSNDGDEGFSLGSISFRGF